MNSSDDVMERVRKALGRTGPVATPPVPPKISEPIARLVHSEIGLPELFARRAQDNKMHLHAVGADDLSGRIVDFLKAHNLRRVALPASPLLERLGVPAALREAGLEARAWDQMTLDELYD